MKVMWNSAELTLPLWPSSKNPFVRLAIVS